MTHENPDSNPNHLNTQNIKSLELLVCNIRNQLGIPISIDGISGEISAQSVITALKEKGIKGEGVMDLLNNWMDQEEEKANNAKDTYIARINFNIQKGLVYIEGGYVKTGLTDLKETLWEIWNQNRDSMYRLLLQKIEEFGEFKDKS